MLEIKNITKDFFHKTVVDNVSFKLKPGEVLGYLGPNGAGKTTTIRILVGLLEPNSGEILYKGNSILKNLEDYKSKIGYVPEEPHVYHHLTAQEYLEFIGQLRGLKENILEKKINKFLELFELSKNIFNPLSSFSKGMIQKVLLIASLLHDPDILLFDEPLSGLDVKTVSVFKSVLKKLSSEGKIIIYSSHILEIVEILCERVIILHKGKILADDSVANLKKIIKKPSLVDVFNKLAIGDNTEDTAQQMINTMKIKE